MIYTLIIKPSVEIDVEKLEKSGQKKLVKKIALFLSEIKSFPRTGTGKPEQLKHYDGYRKGKEFWSRRINRKHRFTYSIDEENKTIEVLSVYGHYDDKL
jgi:toxin YoeB